MEKSIKLDHLTLGVCYYPEHWPRELWADDLARMAEHGIEIIRIAEFAWNKFEPEEGVFTFGFFDDFMDLVAQTDIKVIFCTPTATPPAWLTEKYPEVLNCALDGTPYRHGLRRHYNYNSETYRNFTKEIVTHLAEHYGSHPSIIGWQIDNELNCEKDTFYSETDHAAFRLFLEEKYGSIEALNDAWGTVFWNQTYNDFGQVYLPRPNVNGSGNPHMLLDEKRFISASAISFCRLQADILRRNISEGVFVTTNGFFPHIDSHEMTDTCLDFMTYDSYPNFVNSIAWDSKNPLRDRAWSWNLMRVRSMSPNFGIMEQQSGANGWVDRMQAAMPKPGQMHLWTMQSIAHGADFISYFRWRTAPFGTEIYWHGLNDYANTPNRRLSELKTISAHCKALSGVAGSKCVAKVGFLKDYDNEWDGEFDKWHGPLDRFSDDGWFEAMQQAHVPYDFLFLSKDTHPSDLSRYHTLVYPHATILTEQTAQLLTGYVRGGGRLIMGARTGYKDEFGRCPMRPMPGFAAQLAGVTVADYTFVTEKEPQVTVNWGGEVVPAPLFNDVLVPMEGTHTLATFNNNYYAGKPALTQKNIGAGAAFYFGGGFNAKTASAFIRRLGISSPVNGILQLSPELELTVRTSGEVSYAFVLNYASKPASVTVNQPCLEMLTGNTLHGGYMLEPYGVMVFKLLSDALGK